jgi:hypothetical protein
MTIDLIMRGASRMLAWQPPTPQIGRLTDEAAAILWSLHACTVRDLVDRGIRGQDMVRQLAHTTTMGYEMASALVGFLESVRARPSLEDLEREIAAKRIRLDAATQGMVRPRHQRAKPAPPVPPWARERGRRATR